jgi:mannose-6-phosphate isomerase
MGAHPQAPSRLRDGRTLAEVEPDLPYLMKVLAAAAPLSLQAHPSREQAAAGYAREEAAGIDRAAPERHYRDRNHKPELMVGLEDFSALAGFREPAATWAYVQALDWPPLTAVFEPLSEGGPDALRRVFTAVMAGAVRPEDIEHVAGRAATLAAPDHTADASGPHPPHALEARWTAALARSYPGDPGVIAALMLNALVLHPLEGLFLPSGVLHAYLRGAGIEIMASSDNVLRGGLTPKHVDVAELLAVLSFEPQQPRRLTARDLGGGLHAYPVPVDDFALHRVDLDGLAAAPVAVPVTGPCLVLAVEGSLELGGLALARGAAAYTSDGLPPLSGRGRAFVASAGSAPDGAASA